MATKAKAGAKTRGGKKWSKQVMEHSDAMDLAVRGVQTQGARPSRGR